MLAKYFMLSDENSDNNREIRRWFEKEETPPAREIRKYLSEKLGMPLNLMRKLHSGYSKPVHHTYRTIMESYRAYSMSGMLGERSRRLGFDYHTSSVMRDIVALISGFEEILLNAIQGFVICFESALGLNEAESLALTEQMDFYKLDSLERLEKILSGQDQSPESP